MRYHGRRPLCALLLALGLSCANDARAADADTERARALFDEAGSLERRGQWGAAQDKLRAALRLRETPQLHYALGWALENDDRFLEAKTEYEVATRTAPSHPGGAEVARLAAARLADIQKNTPVLEVRLGRAPTDARVFVDGRELPRPRAGSVRSAVDPGAHVVRVAHADGGVVEQVVYLGRRTTRSIDATAAPVVARGKGRGSDVRQAAPPTPPAPERHGGFRTAARGPVLPWLLVSSGLAFVAGGGGLLVTSSAGDGGGRHTREAVGFALGGAGALTATAGALLLLRGDASAKEDGSPSARAGVMPLHGGALAAASLPF